MNLAGSTAKAALKMDGPLLFSPVENTTQLQESLISLMISTISFMQERKVAETAKLPPSEDRYHIYLC
jgi:hypothetical protein